MTFAFRLLTQQDFPLFAQWLGQPHIRKWWHEPATIEHVEKKYGPAVDGTSKTTIYIIELDKKPIGMIQTYWAQDYPNHAKSVGIAEAIGLDLFIGEPEYIGKGYGPKLLSQFIEEVVKVQHPAAMGVIADPSVDNPTSIRMFEKVGFMKSDIVDDKDGKEQLMVMKL